MQYHKKIITLCAIFFLSCGVMPIGYAKTKFMTYWFSWGQNNPPWIYTQLEDVPQGVDLVAVAFALEDANHQLTLQSSNSDQLKQSIAILHQRSVKVLLSSGGATAGYPWDDMTLTVTQIAQQFSSFIDQYGFDGIDLDVEAVGPGFDRLPDIIQLVKATHASLIVTLTVGSMSSAGVTQESQRLGQALYKNGALNYLDVMNYDQYWNPPVSQCTYDATDMSQNCYIQNVEAVAAVAQQWTGNAAQANAMVMSGIMIGAADDKKVITSDLASQMTQWLSDHNYGGVMTWGVSRDQSGTNLAYSTGLSGYSGGAFTNAIIQILKNQQRV